LVFFRIQIIKSLVNGIKKLFREPGISTPLVVGIEDPDLSIAESVHDDEIFDSYDG